MEAAADLLFDFEEADQDGCACAEAKICKNSALEALAQRIETAARRHPSELARQLHRDVVALMGGHLPNTGLWKSADALYRLASGLAFQGYDVHVRRTLGGGSSECFKSLRHEFLVVRGTGEFRGMEFIVEPFLRQHFLIPHPSPEYEYVLSRTPDVFVGGSCRLAPVVQLLCALMADSFQRQGLPLPPWRTEAAMLSKWLPSPARMLELGPCLACSVPQNPPVSVQEDCDGPQPSLPGEGPLPHPAAAMAAASAGAPDAGGGPRRLLPVLSWVPVDPTGVAAAARRPVTADIVVGFDVCDPTGQERPGGSRCAAERRRGCGGRQRLDVDGREKDKQQRCDGAGLIGHHRRRRRSGSSSGGGGGAAGHEDLLVQLLPYSDDPEEECASPCRGPSAGNDTGSFLLASEASAESSVHVYDTPSLLGSPAGDAAEPAGLFSRASSPSSSPSAGGRRHTGTGMLLPCACLGTGLLSARLLLEPLAAGAAAAAATQLPPPPPSPPPLPKAARRRDGGVLPQALPFPPSARPCAFHTAGGPHVQTRPPTHPEAPAIHLVRLVGALGARSSGSGCGGGAAHVAAAAAAAAQASQRACELAEWLPWGLPH